MKIPLITLLASGISLWLGSVRCAAQEAGAVSLQFLSFPNSIDPEPVQLLVGENKFIEVEIPSNELSAVYKVEAQANWSIVEPAVGDDGKPTFKVLGTARALASDRQLILLIRKGATNSDGFGVLALDNRVAGFGGGKFLFMNAARLDIGCVVGGERFTIKPGQHTIVEPKPESPGSRICHTALYFSKNGKPKNFFSSKWPLSDRARALVFIYQDPTTARLRLHTIRDYL